MSGRLHGVRVPRVPEGMGWVALGAALVPIAYGFAVKIYRKGIKRGTRSRIEEPNAAMKPKEADAPRESSTTSTQADQQVESPAGAEPGHTNEHAASPTGHEEVRAADNAIDQDTQTTPKKYSQPPTKSPQPDQPLNPKRTGHSQPG